MHMTLTLLACILDDGSGNVKCKLRIIAVIFFVILDL